MTMSMEGVTLHDDGTNLIVTMKLQNDSDRPMHAYGSVRRIEYDPASKHLKIELTDQNVVDFPGRIPMMPKLVVVDPNGSTDMSVKLSRYVTKLEPGGDTPNVVQLQAHEAQTIEALVGYGYEPFYVDPRGKKTLLEQFRRWEKGTVHGTGRRDDKEST